MANRNVARDDAGNSPTGLRPYRLPSIVLITVMLTFTSTRSDALPLSLYRYEAQAQAHCPDDTVVWLDFRKGIYYLKRHKRYGRGASGLYVCRHEASDSGYRRSILGRR